MPDAHLAELLLPDDVKQRLLSLAAAACHEDAPLILYFQGPAGTGKRTTAEALCRELGLSLVAMDARQLAASEDLPFARGICLALREARLAGLASPAGAPQSAALYWHGFDVLLDEAHAEPRRALIEALEGRGLARAPCLTFLAGAAPWEPTGALYDVRFVRVEFVRPAYTERLRLWSTFLADAPLSALPDANLPALAGTFRFTAGQIRDAAATARNLALWRDPGEGRITREDLYTASRLHSNPGLSALAQKLTPRYAWDDITLPADRLQLLREICNQLKHRAQVYETWGFGGKLSLGKGLNVMFAGPSGTGKTMAAEILAHELGLDLYKIDLSSVVSKYIGETEKNLARIFAEAETSNAILFFDEADALFGKRSEVRDSHDRYANIEISYLLQRMEEYDGMAILASNLHKNMDEAFVRRMHFTVEFPFPEEAHRLRIWQKIWPAATPRSADLDLPFMARHFEITGGNIRNIAVAAAFLAADDGQVVSMTHLLAATQREYQKMGKVLVDGPATVGLQLQRS